MQHSLLKSRLLQKTAAELVILIHIRNILPTNCIIEETEEREIQSPSEFSFWPKA